MALRSRLLFWAIGDFLIRCGGVLFQHTFYSRSRFLLIGALFTFLWIFSLPPSSFYKISRPHFSFFHRLFSLFINLFIFNRSRSTSKPLKKSKETLPKPHSKIKTIPPPHPSHTNPHTHSTLPLTKVLSNPSLTKIYSLNKRLQSNLISGSGCVYLLKSVLK